jgi:hypothetical protein
MNSLVVLCGGREGEAWLYQRALRRLVGPERLRLVADDPEVAAARAARWGLTACAGFEAALGIRTARIFVLLHPFAERTARAREALAGRRAVALSPPFARSAEEGRQLVQFAGLKRATLCALEPLLQQSALLKLLEIADQDRLGHISLLRLRSLLAGSGGWDPCLTPDFTAAEPAPDIPAAELLFREIAEKVSIAERIGGPLTEIVHQGRLGEAGSVLVAWKHAADRRYGHLEIVRAPGIRLRSPFDPREDTVELTGSAGVAWASHGMGSLRNEPAVRFYLQEDLLCYQRVDEEFGFGIHAAVKAFLERAEARTLDGPALRRVVDALAAAEIAVKGGADGQRRPTGPRW